MFFDIFELRTREQKRACFYASEARQRGTCTSGDGTIMKFRLYGEAAYILPPKAVREGEPKGVWIHRRGLSMLDPEVQR